MCDICVLRVNAEGLTAVSSQAQVEYTHLLSTQTQQSLLVLQPRAALILCLSSEAFPLPNAAFGLGPKSLHSFHFDQRNQLRKSGVNPSLCHDHNPAVSHTGRCPTETPHLSVSSALAKKCQRIHLGKSSG